MKFKLIIFCVCFLHISLIQSQEFVKRSINTSLKNVRGSRVVDLDNDGNLDLVAIYKGAVPGPGPGISAWFNDGNGNFDTFLKVHESKAELLNGHADDITVLDVNNDGFLDIVAAIQFDRITNGGFEYETHDLAWWPNNRNRGFDDPIIIEENVALRSQSLELIDVDNNGFDDIIAYSFDWNGVVEEAVWYWPNTGSSVFSGKVELFQGDYRYFKKAKINDDDLEDLVLVDFLTNVRLGINNGTAGFDIEPVSNISTDNFFRIGLGNIDNDELLDLTTSVFSSQTDFLSWHQGLGNREFGDEQPILFDLGNTTAIDTKIDDLDDDGDSDIVVTTFSDDLPSLHIWENLGNGDFENRRSMNEDQTAGYSVHVVDIDSDGDKDIVQTTSEGVYWFENMLIGIQDDDGDGIANNIDECPNTAIGDSVNGQGCSPVQLVDLGAEDILVKSTGLTCVNSNDGYISIDFVKDYQYSIDITSEEGFFKSYTNVAYNETFIESELRAGTYQVCIGISDIPEYSPRCFSMEIKNVESIASTGKISIDENNLNGSITVKGSSLYVVQVNGKEYRFTADSERATSIAIPLEQGINDILISTEKNCQGFIKDTILMDKVVLLNNTDGSYSLNGLESYQTPVLEIYSSSGNLVRQQKILMNTPTFNFDLNGLSSGYYFLNLTYPDKILSFKLYKGGL